MRRLLRRLLRRIVGSALEFTTEQVDLIYEAVMDSYLEVDPLDLDRLSDLDEIELTLWPATSQAQRFIKQMEQRVR